MYTSEPPNSFRERKLGNSQVTGSKRISPSTIKARRLRENRAKNSVASFLKSNFPVITQRWTLAVWPVKIFKKCFSPFPQSFNQLSCGNLVKSTRGTVRRRELNGGRAATIWRCDKNGIGGTRSSSLKPSGMHVKVRDWTLQHIGEDRRSRRAF